MSPGLEPAWVLHTRPYRDTSLLLELLTLTRGRVGAVARGARGPRSRSRGWLRPGQYAALIHTQ
ncbi:MAG TPA: recombination protein O N-terminal domain-containing protein, partial [Plasticicumulans sp.]|uniref:recombination protein O N-terminal domain-containing protein n=1 Tax=Plasticicumulans sp. TaxID=2307179 RepID=UPI002C0EEC88